MFSKGLIIAVATASLVAAPVVASAQTQFAPNPQQEVVSGDNELVSRRGLPVFWIPLTAAVLAALAIWILLDDDDPPVSP